MQIKSIMFVDDAVVDPEDRRICCELQTLFALPQSGGRIMSFHLYQYSLASIKSAGLGEEFIEAIEGLKKGNTPDMWRHRRAGVWGTR